MIISHKILLAFCIAAFGSCIVFFQYAFGDESRSPFQALWDAIYDLQSSDDRLQAQIDGLRAERITLQQADGPSSELSTRVWIEDIDHEHGEIKLKSLVSNEGSAQANGVRLTLFYKMPLFRIVTIESDLCRNMERGIIQCDLGTLGSGEKISTFVDITALENDVPTSFTADVSSTTPDSIPTNNHIVIDYVTGSTAVTINELSDTNQDELGGSDSAENATSSQDDHENSEQSYSADNQTQSNQTAGNENQTSDDSSSDANASNDQQAQEPNGDEASDNQTASGGEENQTSNSSSDAGNEPEEAANDDVSQGGENGGSGNQTSTSNETG